MPIKNPNIRVTEWGETAHYLRLQTLEAKRDCAVRELLQNQDIPKQEIEKIVKLVRSIRRKTHYKK